MIVQSNWIEHHREEDGELLGYLVGLPGDPECFQPMTIFGYPMAEPSDREDATDVLDAHGLSYLADRWYLDLDGRDEPIAVTIAEVGPNRITVRNADYGYDGDIGDPFVLDHSGVARLTRDR